MDISIAPPNVDASTVKLPVVTLEFIVKAPVPAPIETVKFPLAETPVIVTAPD